MSKSDKRKTRTHPLVEDHLERISSKVFSDYPQQLTDLIGQRHGVYALYKGERLYYVGLASDLRKRIKHHLRDKHAGKWNKFSLYLIRGAHHIKEIESLVLRIADPKGNAMKGKLPDAHDLSKDLRQQVQEAQRKKLEVIFGEKPQRVMTKSRDKGKVVTKARSDREGKSPPLGPYIDRAFKIKARYKGAEYSAWVSASGKINFDGVVYNSPSAAGRAVVNRSINGWSFWRCKDSDGNWVKLNILREKG